MGNEASTKIIAEAFAASNHSDEDENDNKKKYTVETARRCGLMISSPSNRAKVAAYFEKHDGMCGSDEYAMEPIIERLGEDTFMSYVVEKDLVGGCFGWDHHFTTATRSSCNPI